MSRIQNVSRRGFLQGILSGGALVLGAHFAPGVARAAQMADTPADRAVFHPNMFLGIETDGTVYIVAHRSEMGNGSRTALPRALADELDADWNRVKIVQVVGDARYGSQDTDASRSIHEFFDLMREAGATARLMVIRAAGQWAVPASECSSVLHAVVHAPTHRQSAYGELVLAASRLPVPKKEDVQLKPRTEWRYIGKDASLYDLEDICTGRAIYGMDARLEGMVYASVEHPPVLGGKVKSYQDQETSWLLTPEREHRFVASEKQRIAAPARDKFHAWAGLALVGLETQRYLAVTFGRALPVGGLGSSWGVTAWESR